MKRSATIWLMLSIAFATTDARAGELQDISALEQALRDGGSATAVLEDWCQARQLADPPVIVAERVGDADRPAPPEVRRAFGADIALRYRHVRLRCGTHILSIAHNWYAPERLTPAMNAQLDGSDVPFGKVIRPLGFSRKSLSSTRLSPRPPARRQAWRAARAPTAKEPPSILEQRAILLLPDGRPVSFVIEHYSAELYAKGGR